MNYIPHISHQDDFNEKNFRRDVALAHPLIDLPTRINHDLTVLKSLHNKKIFEVISFMSIYFAIAAILSTCLLLLLHTEEMMSHPYLLQAYSIFILLLLGFIALKKVTETPVTITNATIDDLVHSSLATSPFYPVFRQKVGQIDQALEHISGSHDHLRTKLENRRSHLYQDLARTFEPTDAENHHTELQHQHQEEEIKALLNETQNL